jgi:epoxyqueuosine reductase
MSLLEFLTAVADEHGSKLGVTDLAPFPVVEAEIERRKRSGEAGSLGFTYRDPARSSEPAATFPWALSIVVVAVPYLTAGDGRETDRSVARFADGDRYVKLREVLEGLVGVVEEAGYRGESVYDDNRLIDRAVAVRAGVAWWGKSTMALAPGFGPWFLIGSVVTDARIQPSPPMRRTCGTCTACLPACPTGAIVAPGVLDARLCLAAIFQSRGPIPRDLRVAAGTRVYGCDECLTACPPGDRTLDALPAASSIDPVAILSMSDHDLNRIFDHWYVPGRKMRFIRRNALVAVGNLRDPDDVDLLSRYLEHPDELLRGHAAWALGRIAGPQASSALLSASTSEKDPEVKDEILAALPR